MECPICGSSKTKRITDLKGSRTGTEHPLFGCLACCCLFQRPGYHEDDATLRGDLAWHVSSKDLFPEEERRKILSKLLKIRPSAKTLLDVGCGIGSTILVAKELGLTCEGIEPNYSLPYTFFPTADFCGMILLQNTA